MRHIRHKVFNVGDSKSCSVSVAACSRVFIEIELLSQRDITNVFKKSLQFTVGLKFQSKFTVIQQRFVTANRLPRNLSLLLDALNVHKKISLIQINALCATYFLWQNACLHLFCCPQIIKFQTKLGRLQWLLVSINYHTRDRHYVARISVCDLNCARQLILGK